MNLTKSKTAKIAAGFVALALAFVFFVTPVTSNAQTAEELQAQINSLLATIAALQAQIGGTTGGSMSSYTYNTDLTIGSTGTDVTALQTKLVEAGFLTMPSGVAMGYFGSLTQAAVKAWQASVGLPSTGFFGPLSRAKLNSTAGTVPPVGGTPGCPTGAMYNSTTGAPCTTTPAPVAGCPAGALFNSLTGAPCATTPVTGASEGSITTKLAASPTNNANVRFVADVPVYGVEVTAVGSPMLVDRADLQVSVIPSGGSAQNPSLFINTVKAWNGTTLLKSWPVTSTTFSKDSSDRYHAIFSGLAVNIAQDAVGTVTFTFSVNSISSTDVVRAVTVQGYAGNTQNIRAVDSAGYQSYADMSGSANTRSHTFKSAGSSTLTVTLNNALTPKASNNRVNTTSGISKMIMEGFSAKSESGDSKITKIYVANNATTSDGLASTLYLCAGSDTTCASPLGSVTAGVSTNAAHGTAYEALFNSLSILVPQDTTSNFLIAADYPTTVGGQMASTSLSTNSVQWEQPDGSTSSSTPTGAIAGTDQYMGLAVPVWSILETPTPIVTNPSFSGTATGTVVAKLKFLVTGNGGTLTKPVIEDFGLCFASSTQTTYTSAAVNCIGAGDTSFTSRVIDSISPTDATVGDGGSYTVTVAAVLTKASTAGTAVSQMNTIWQMVATSTRATIGGASIRQTWNTGDWHTPFSATLQ